MPEKLSCRHIAAIGFLGVLSPMVREVPGATAAYAGHAGWLSVLLAAVPLSLLLWCMARMTAGPRSLADSFCACLGRRTGQLLTGLYAVWFLYLAAYTLRCGAERLTNGVGTPLFMCVMLLTCLPSALGSPRALRTLGRTAMVLRPVLLLILLVMCALTLSTSPLAGRYLPEPGQERGLFQAAVAVISPLGVAFYLAFADRSPGDPPRILAGWLSTTLAVTGALSLSVSVLFGPALAAELRNPFFVMVRDLTLFGTLRRMDTVVVALWVFSDFVLLSMLLCLAKGNFRRLLPERAQNSRWLGAVCLFGVLGLAWCMAPDAMALDAIGDTVIFWGRIVSVCMIPPLVWIWGRLRGQILPLV